jgi:rubrerythrin
LWLLDDRDFDRARRIVTDFDRVPVAGPSWRCPECGEALEGQFSACWRCGAPRPQI